MDARKLLKHAFTREAFANSDSVDEQIKARGINPNSTTLDEAAWYVKRVAFSVAQMISWVKQLEDAILYLTNFDYSPAMRRAGIDRSEHLLYNVENFLVRYPSTYDRALQLANRVFHIQIHDEHVFHANIVSNLSVQNSDVVPRLKALQKLIKEKSQERHTLIHRHSYSEDDIDRLRRLYIPTRESFKSRNGRTFDDLQRIRTELLKRTAQRKRAEFTEMNKCVAERTHELFTALHDAYRSKMVAFRLMHKALGDASGLTLPVERDVWAELADVVVGEDKQGQSANSG